MQTGMNSNKLLDQFAVVNRMVIPHQHDGTVHFAQQVAEESNHLLPGDVHVVKTSVHSDTLLFRTDQHSPDDIDATVMRDTGAHNRRLAAGCPGAFERRNQRKSAFILETKRCAKITPLFLSAAMCNASSARWLHRRAAMPAVVVSGCSTPCVAVNATHCWGGISPQKASISNTQLGLVSSSLLSSPGQMRRDSMHVPAFEAVYRSTVATGQVSCVREPHLRVRLAATARRFVCSLQLVMPSARMSCLWPRGLTHLFVGHLHPGSIRVSAYAYHGTCDILLSKLSSSDRYRSILARGRSR